MGQTREQRIINQVVGKPTIQKRTPIATDMFLPNHSGDHSAGMVKTTPINDLDIVNKKYVDDTIDADITTHAADADAHQDEVSLVTTSHDYLSLSGQAITLGTVDISDDTNLVAGTNCTLSGDTLNVDDAFLKNDQADTGVGLTLTGDNSSADTAYVPMVLYNTDATPPTASNFPIGTIYIQYTA